MSTLIINATTGEVTTAPSDGPVADPDDRRRELISELRDLDAGMARVSEELALVSAGTMKDISDVAKARVMARKALRDELALI